MWEIVNSFQIQGWLSGLNLTGVYGISLWYIDKKIIKVSMS